MIKLGTIVKDTATGFTGMLTRFEYRMGGQKYYLMQPRGLNPEDGQPLKTIWVDEPRIKDGIQISLPEYWPVEILGTKIEDEASGFNGVAISISLHISGCIHVQIQPDGKTKIGNPIDTENFDIRRCSGKALKKLSEDEREKSQREKPSPGKMDNYLPKM